MLPDTAVPGPDGLERRTLGETDLRVFTAEALPASRHRPDGTRRRLRVLRDPASGRPVLRLAVLALAAALAAGCASGSERGEGGQRPLTAGSGGTDLRGVCPATVTVQTSWYSQIEHFAAYPLLRAGYTVDPARKRVTGPLVSAGTLA